MYLEEKKKSIVEQILLSVQIVIWVPTQSICCYKVTTNRDALYAVLLVSDV